MADDPSFVLEAVPNASTADETAIARLERALARPPAVRLVHRTSDARHGRTVFTAIGEPEPLGDAIVDLGRRAAATIDLRRHHGVHPRVGALDVVPLVPLAWPEELGEEGARERAAELARELARRLAEEAGLITVLYGDADPKGRGLPDLRRGGPRRLLERIDSGEVAAHLPRSDSRALRERSGVTCVGSRFVLVAFNVELATGEVGHARKIAAALREQGGGLPAVRALGFRLGPQRVQVSMNLLDHRKTTVEAAHARVRELADAAGLEIARSELIGCVPRAAWPEGLGERIAEPDMTVEAEPRRILESWLPGGELAEDPGLGAGVGGDTPGGDGRDRRLRMLDLPLAEAERRVRELVEEIGERPFRADQVLHGVFQKRRRSVEDIATLPKGLRRELDGRLRIGLLEEIERAESRDGTVKYLWRLPDGEEIESVAIPTEHRTTFCVSSQVGCALRCRFCATGRLGLKRNLTAGEIIDQVLAMLADGRQAEESLNVVFMGQGEPGYTMDAVLAACRTLNDPKGLGIGARHVTISTAGVVPAIARLAREPLQLRLAVSLHTGVEETRRDLMNVAEKHDLTALREACRAYHDATRRFVTFEVAVMPGVNDSETEARALAAFASSVPSKINLIPYNPVEEFEAAAAPVASVEAFRERLAASYRGEIMVRRTRGRDIEAACGMLHRHRAEREFTPEDDPDGTSDGAADGASDGAADGASDRATDGASDGAADGASDRATDGASDGAADGASDRATDGASDRAADGASDRAADGATDGASNSSSDGESSTGGSDPRGAEAAAGDESA